MQIAIIKPKPSVGGHHKQQFSVRLFPFMSPQLDSSWLALQPRHSIDIIEQSMSYLKPPHEVKTLRIISHSASTNFETPLRLSARHREFMVICSLQRAKLSGN